MPILKNPRHELFAQELAKGNSATVAYQLAGYAPSRTNADRLRSNETIEKRLTELLQKVETKTLVTVERIVEEASNLAFCNVTDGVKVVKGKVFIEDTAILPREFTAAIAGIRSTKDGLEVKFHDKMAALNLLGKHTGAFKENINLNVTISLADLVNASFGTPPKQIEGEKA